MSDCGLFHGALIGLRAEGRAGAVSSGSLAADPLVPSPVFPAGCSTLDVARVGVGGPAGGVRCAGSGRRRVPDLEGHVARVILIRVRLIGGGNSRPMRALGGHIALSYMAHAAV